LPIRLRSAILRRSLLAIRPFRPFRSSASSPSPEPSSEGYAEADLFEGMAANPYLKNLTVRDFDVLAPLP